MKGSSEESEAGALKVGDVVKQYGLQRQPYRKDACAVRYLDLMWRSAGKRAHKRLELRLNGRQLVPRQRC